MKHGCKTEALEERLQCKQDNHAPFFQELLLFDGTLLAGIQYLPHWFFSEN